MARLIWTETSLADLEEIAEYIALDNIDAAKNLVKKIFNAVTRLEAHPNSGRRPPELKNTRYREVIVYPCRIFYRLDNDIVYVLYVMRGERSLRNYILDERNKTREK
ncbi:MAG TPA: type II toxin-antitoxin system RelE/ParE family toxin [Spirochaetota bacterium]|nr:type II toxin-antitoxin system RelE/ParE family toxin [Spirochaetota bacterium]HPI91414.1 type II toxin-antitoxin system RelE/ParE family toxin [Spirochaetota bacterium]HPR48427.1 type II toxin-antitoxin system RelE/ParE family toxin [Spirochaetota bacterium]